VGSQQRWLGGKSCVCPKRYPNGSEFSKNIGRELPHSGELTGLGVKSRTMKRLSLGCLFVGVTGCAILLALSRGAVADWPFAPLSVLGIYVLIQAGACVWWLWPRLPP